jgi:hypothetical protein
MYVYWVNNPNDNTVYYSYKTISGDEEWSSAQVLLVESAGVKSPGEELSTPQDSTGSLGVYYISDDDNLRYSQTVVYGGMPYGEALAPTSVTSTSATFNGYCVSNGNSTTIATFHYNVGMGNVSVEEYAGAVYKGDYFHIDVTGIVPGALCYYWIAFENDAGVYSSNTVMFYAETDDSPAAPIVVTNAATYVTSSSAQLHGYLSYDGNLDTYCGFELRMQGTSTWTRAWVMTEDSFLWGDFEVYDIIPRGNTFFKNVSNLVKDKVYEYRAIAKNSLTDPNWVYGETLTFSTGHYTAPTPTPASTGGTGLIPPGYEEMFNNLSDNVKLLLAIVITIGGDVILGMQMSRSKGVGIVIGVYTLFVTILFIVVGWYPTWVTVLLCAIVGLLLFFFILGKK